MRNCIFTCFLIALLVHSHDSMADDGLAKKRLFVIGISVSSPDRKLRTETDKQFANFECPTCLSDVKGMGYYFENFVKRNRFVYDSVFTWTFINSDITLDGLYAAFRKVEDMASSSDQFVFYYAANSWGFDKRPGSSNAEGFYSLNTKLSENDPFGKYSFTLADLKAMTDRIPSLEQLIVFDSGDGEVIQSDFYRNFFSDNPAQAKFTQKNRIIICPEKYSSEKYDAAGVRKGDLFNVISSMPDSLNVFTLFKKSIRGSNLAQDIYKNFMQTWYAKQVGLYAQIKVLREHDYIDVLAAIKPSLGAMRGAGTTATERPVDSSYNTRTKKALIIATNNYDAPDLWAPLQNAVADGKAIAKLLADQYKYEVKTVYNGSREEVLNSILELCESAGNPNDQYVIYFAGHGYYDKAHDVGYIVCRDSKNFKSGQPTPLEKSSYLDYTVLFGNLDQYFNKVILVTDVCYGGMASNSLLQAKNPLANPDFEASRRSNAFKRFLSSGIESVPDFVRMHNGMASEHSPFAQRLLEILGDKKSTLRWEDVIAQIHGKELSPTPLDFDFGKNVKPNEFIF